MAAQLDDFTRNVIRWIGKWEAATVALPRCRCICAALLGFNAFCQIQNFTTKHLIMLWHSAAGKRAGLESVRSRIQPVKTYIKEL